MVTSVLTGTMLDSVRRPWRWQRTRRMAGISRQVEELQLRHLQRTTVPHSQASYLREEAVKLLAAALHQDMAL